MNKQQMILSRIPCKDPLKFMNTHLSKDEEIKFLCESLEENIKTVLLFSKNHWSFNVSSNNILTPQTPPGRARSAGDIWRHILFYKPEISIFEVMETMYKIQDDISGQYCYDIKKRVFWHHTYFWDTEHVSEDEIDEFGLTFYEWENLNVEPEQGL